MVPVRLAGKDEHSMAMEQDTISSMKSLRKQERRT